MVDTIRELERGLHEGALLKPYIHGRTNRRSMCTNWSQSPKSGVELLVCKSRINSGGAELLSIVVRHAEDTAYAPVKRPGTEGPT